MTTVYRGAELVPDAWRSAVRERIRTFNPGIIRDGDGWLMAYRVVGEPDLRRRIAVCRLDNALKIVPGSAAPVSDWITFPTPNQYAAQTTTWFADPRLYCWDDRIFLYWNSGWHEPRNEQFLVELDRRTLRPLGPARELRLATERRALEKNWVMFQHGSEYYAVYSVNPHRVLRFLPAGEGPIVCEDIGEPVPNAGGFALAHGGLRGGAPPQQIGPSFHSICHAIVDDPNGYRYVAAVYRFHAEFPFGPETMPLRPLDIPVPAEARRHWPKLNTAVGHVIYPSGAAWADDRWLISVGVDDETCLLTELSLEQTNATLAVGPTLDPERLSRT